MNYVTNLINISGSATAIIVFYNRKWTNRVQHIITYTSGTEFPLTAE